MWCGLCAKPVDLLGYPDEVPLGIRPRGIGVGKPALPHLVFWRNFDSRTRCASAKDDTGGLREEDWANSIEVPRHLELNAYRLACGRPTATAKALILVAAEHGVGHDESEATTRSKVQLGRAGHEQSRQVGVSCYRGFGDQRWRSLVMRR